MSEQIFAFIMGGFFGAGIASVFLRPTQIKLPKQPMYTYKTTEIHKTPTQTKQQQSLNREEVVDNG